MDAIPYECSLFISAKACSRAAYTGSRTGAFFACTDDSGNIDSSFALPALFEEDETTKNCLLLINQSINQSTNGTINRKI
jgi:hypothetical protein